MKHWRKTLLAAESWVFAATVLVAGFPQGSCACATNPGEASADSFTIRPCQCCCAIPGDGLEARSCCCKAERASSRSDSTGYALPKSRCKQVLVRPSLFASSPARESVDARAVSADLFPPMGASYEAACTSTAQRVYWLAWRVVPPTDLVALFQQLTI
jgi:hypothetical protein